MQAGTYILCSVEGKKPLRILSVFFLLEGRVDRLGIFPTSWLWSCAPGVNSQELVMSYSCSRGRDWEGGSTGVQEVVTALDVRGSTPGEATRQWLLPAGNCWWCPRASMSSLLLKPKDTNL